MTSVVILNSLKQVGNKYYFKIKDSKLCPGIPTPRLGIPTPYLLVERNTRFNPLLLGYMVSISIFCMCCVFLCFFSSCPISRGLNTVSLLSRYVALKVDAQFYTQGLPSSFSRTSVIISVHMACVA